MRSGVREGGRCRVGLSLIVTLKKSYDTVSLQGSGNRELPPQEPQNHDPVTDGVA